MSEEQKHTSRDDAWEEFMSTGIDPTGGDIGPDFDQEEDNPRRIMTQRPSSAKAGLSGTTVVCLLISFLFLVFLAVNAVVKRHREAAGKEQAVRQKEQEEYQKELQKRHKIEIALQKAIDDAAAQSSVDKEARQESVRKLLRSGVGLYGDGYRPATSPSTMESSGNALPRRGTAFGDGYWDGYEEGFNDADGYQQYGFKYDETTDKYGGKALESYVQGYREGWKDGIEEVQYQYEMGGGSE